MPGLTRGERRPGFPPGALIVALAALAGCDAGEDRDMPAEAVAAELRGVRVEPGLWQVTSAVTGASGPNLPREAKARIERHRRTSRTCISAAQAARPEANFLRARASGQCSYRHFSMRDGRVRGEMRCAGDGLPGTTVTSMDGRYGPRLYDVRMRTVSTGMPEGANMIVETRTISRRIGDCPPAAPQPPRGGPT